MKVTASPKNVSNVEVEVTITATVQHWREFQEDCLSMEQYAPIKRELVEAIERVVRNLESRMTDSAPARDE